MGDIASDLRLEDFCRIERFQNTYSKYLVGFDIKDFDFVGIVEEYAAGLALFQKRFGLQIPQNVIVHNANPHKTPTDRYRIKPEVVQLIRRLNAEDMEIYDMACVAHRRMRGR